MRRAQIDMTNGRLGRDILLFSLPLMLSNILVPTIIVMMGSCVFRVVWIYTVFAHFHTLPSLYLLYIFSWTITAVAEILYFVHCYRAQINRPGLSGGELSKAQ